MYLKTNNHRYLYMNRQGFFKAFRSLIFLLIFMVIISACPLYTQAAEQVDYEKEQEERKSLPIQSNTVIGWPAGPEIGAQAAVLMDIDTKVILYAKNIHEKLYPASTTKIMTCLLAMENGNLDDMITFSHDAVFSVPSDGSNIGMDVGQSVTLEECLYGVMVGSANEAANAAGEYVSGSIPAFVDLMNSRAKELGCTDTHFCNTNGLHEDNHYTSAYDLALIASEFFKNEMLCKIGNTPRYHFEATATQPDDFYLNNKHQLITGETPYKGILGGKTGYTGLARQTLVTACEQDGMRLVCVVLKEESPHQFTDTATLFDYGFSNFKRVNVADTETRYQINNDNFFKTDNDVFGNSDPFLFIDKKSSVIVPNTIPFDKLKSSIVYGTYDEPNKIAEITYSFKGTVTGTADLLTAADAGNIYSFHEATTNMLFEKQTEEEGSTSSVKTIFINVKWILLTLTAASVILFILILLISTIRNYHFAHHFTNKKKRKGLH